MMNEIVKVYADYVLAYDKYIDKYLQTMSEDDCEFEIEVCDGLYDRLMELVSEFTNGDDDYTNELMDILSITERSTKKINMAQNLQTFFNETQLVF
jgi:hypothetical protein